MLVSTSKTCITPKGKFFPCYLLGHAIRVDKAIGVADELWANAIVLKNQKSDLIWVTIDLAGINEKVSDEIREICSKKYGVSKAAVNIGFVHTHSAPEYDAVSPFFGTEKAAVPGYMDFVKKQILKAIDECFENEFKECKAYYKTTIINGCYSNRNGKDKVSDKSITTITFESEGQVVAGIVNFTCHPTVLGPQNLLVSADLAGYLARSLQQRWGVYALVMQGAAGDMSNRLYRQGNDYAELKRVGEEIIHQMDANTQKWELHLEDVAIQEVHYYKHYTLNPSKKIEQLRQIEEKIAKAKTFDEKKVYSSSLAVLKAQIKENKTEGSLDCTTILYKMGDLFLASIPAELFSCFGLEIKKAMGVKCPIIWGYSNYSVGYLVDKAEYGDSFESAAGEIPCGTTEEIVEGIIQTIQKMKEDK